MFRLTFWKQIMFTAMGVMVISVSSLAKTRIPHIFNFVLEPVRAIKSAGMADLELVVYPYKEFNQENRLTEITVTPLDDLQYSGDLTRSVSASKEDPYRTILSVVIAPNDTCGIRIELRCGRFYWKFERHFVSYGDSIIVFQVDPRHIIPPFPTQPRTGPRVGWWIPGEFPELDSLYGPPIPPYDTTGIYTSTTNQHTKDEVARLQMRKLERETLPDKQSQEFHVDDTLWRRKRGEQYFTPVKPIKDIDAYMKHMTDSIANIPDDIEEDVCLVIETAEQLKFAERLLGQLSPTADTNCFHLRVNWGRLKKLDSVGIRVIFPELAPHEHPRLQDEVTPESSERGAIDFDLLSGTRERFAAHEHIPA